MWSKWMPVTRWLWVGFECPVSSGKSAGKKARKVVLLDCDGDAIQQLLVDY